MAFLKGVITGAFGVIGAVVVGAAVCAFRDIKKEKREAWKAHTTIFRKNTKINKRYFHKIKLKIRK